FVEWAAGEVGWFGESVGEVWHGVHAAAEAVCHGAGLGTKGWSAIDRAVLGACLRPPTNDGQVEQRGAGDGGVTVGATGQAPHKMGGARSIESRPPIVWVGPEHVDASRVFANLTGERDGAAAVPLANFEAEQF